MERIPASERTREKLRALMAGRSEVEDERSGLVRLAARTSTRYPSTNRACLGVSMTDYLVLISPRKQDPEWATRTLA
jgi:hypothetical protein